VPEILPIAGRRLHVSYLGQLKQCKNCFGLGHILATCEKEKTDWLEYVATLHKSGKFPDSLFDGWMPALKQFHSSYKEPQPPPQGEDLRQVLDLNKIARNETRGAQPQAQNWQNHNQGNFNGYQQNYNQGQSRNFRPRGRGYQRGNNRGGRGRQNSSNYFNSY